MALRQQISVIFCVVILSTMTATAQSGNGQRGVIDLVNPVLPDPILQHSKETYILNGCAYCHGVNLQVQNGEAADLMHSTLVGKDDNGNLISRLLRTGIPQTAKLSPMPQFSDLSDQQLTDIARWIHYARQQARYKDLTEVKNPAPGNAAEGRTYFSKSCVSCHSPERDLANLAKKYDSAVLRARILRPEFVDVPQSWKLDQLNDIKTANARRRHLSLLENYSHQDIANLIAFLRNTN